MSRSRKKVGHHTDGHKRYFVQNNWYNRKFRRRNRQRVQLGLEPFLARELINPWDIHDYFYLALPVQPTEEWRERNLKYYRK